MIFKKKKELESEREELENIVRTVLTPEERLEYYRGLSEDFKDSDTYAALNFFFFLGIHDLYLGKFTYFFVTLFAVIFFAYSLFAGNENMLNISILVCVVVGTKGVLDLFRSEAILYEYNTNVIRKRLEKVRKQRADFSL